MPCLTLRATLPEKNLDRDYTILVQKGLFNLWVVNILYGKWGAPRHRKRQYSFDAPKQAQSFIKKTLRKRLNAQNRIGCNYKPAQTSGSEKDLQFWFESII